MDAAVLCHQARVLKPGGIATVHPKEWWAILQEEVENCIVDLHTALHAVIAAEGCHVTKAEKKRYHISLYIVEWFY